MREDRLVLGLRRGVTMTPWTPSRIRALRKRLGLSQPRFAELIGAAVGTVRYWEQRQRTGPKKTPGGIATAFLKHLDAETPAREA